MSYRWGVVCKGEGSRQVLGGLRKQRKPSIPQRGGAEEGCNQLTEERHTSNCVAVWTPTYPPPYFPPPPCYSSGRKACMRGSGYEALGDGWVLTPSWSGLGTLPCRRYAQSRVGVHVWGGCFLLFRSFSDQVFTQVLANIKRVG